jgi:hypothetical protein
MKRNKTPSQPTRVMPKRKTARQNPVETSVNTVVRKRKRQSSNDSQVNGQKDAERNQDTAAADSSTGIVACGSPDANCSICLSAIDNRAFTDSCYHTFCFKCLLEWSRVRAVCPLCKKSFTAIVHDFQSYDNYQLYQLPRYDQGDDADQMRSSSNNTHTVLNGIPNMPSPSPFALFHPVGFWISPGNRSTRLRHAEQMMAFRRRVYADQLQLQGIWSSSGLVIQPMHISPTLFACNPQLVERVRPWIIRDLHVLINRYDVPAVCTIVIDLLRQFQITSEDFYEQLFPHLGSSTRLFLRELDSFARSPYDMPTYDEQANYELPVTASEGQALNHIENISSSDDSDVEITRSETGMDNSSNLQSALSTFPAVNSLFVALRSRMWSAVNPGWDSPIPGPSGCGLTVPPDEDCVSESSVGTADISVVEDVSSDWNSAPDMSTAPLSDCDSDVVLIDSHADRHSPIMLVSSSDDDEITILSPREARQLHRRQHRKRRHSTVNATAYVRVPDEVIPIHSSAVNIKDTDGLVQTVAAANQSAIGNEVEGNNDSCETFSNHPRLGSKSISVNDEHGSTSELLTSHRNKDDEESKKLEHFTGELVTSSISRPLRKRARNSGNMDTEDSMALLADSQKLPACKKHISGHKSSKRKLSDAVLEACGYSTADVSMSKSEVADDAVSSCSASKDENTLEITGCCDSKIGETVASDAVYIKLANDDRNDLHLPVSDDLNTQNGKINQSSVNNQENNDGDCAVSSKSVGNGLNICSKAMCEHSHNITEDDQKMVNVTAIQNSCANKTVMCDCKCHQSSSKHDSTDSLFTCDSCKSSNRPCSINENCLSSAKTHVEGVVKESLSTAPCHQAVSRLQCPSNCIGDSAITNTVVSSSADHQESMRLVASIPCSGTTSCKTLLVTDNKLLPDATDSKVSTSSSVALGEYLCSLDYTISGCDSHARQAKVTGLPVTSTDNSHEQSDDVHSRSDQLCFIPRDPSVASVCLDESDTVSVQQKPVPSNISEFNHHNPVEVFHQSAAAEQSGVTKDKLADVQIIEDSDCECISVHEDDGSDDSEVEWLPDSSVTVAPNDTAFPRQHCISVSSCDSSQDGIEVVTDKLTDHTVMSDSKDADGFCVHSNPLQSDEQVTTELQECISSDSDNAARQKCFKVTDFVKVTSTDSDSNQTLPSQLLSLHHEFTSETLEDNSVNQSEQLIHKPCTDTLDIDVPNAMVQNTVDTSGSTVDWNSSAAQSPATQQHVNVLCLDSECKSVPSVDCSTRCSSLPDERCIDTASTAKFRSEADLALESSFSDSCSM